MTARERKRMHKRQKIVLGILLETPRIPTSTALMNLIFLMKRETYLSQERSFYEFVPYESGPFSFTAYRDFEIFSRLGYLNGNGDTVSTDMLDEAHQGYESLPSKIREAIVEILERYGSLSEEALRKHVHAAYPWFTTQNGSAVSSRNVRRRAKTIYTAGYEGVSIELFFQNILKSGIERILDVRSNPVSRKYGFSKKTLKELCARLEIDYVHLAELGIPSAYRTSLNGVEDYEKLLAKYEKSILPKATSACEKATRLMRDRPSVLVCFEVDEKLCHRSRLAQAIASRTTMDIVHLRQTSGTGLWAKKQESL